VLGQVLGQVPGRGMGPRLPVRVLALVLVLAQERQLQPAFCHHMRQAARRHWRS